MSIHIALYEPDIPQNVGAAIRLSACIGWPLDIIEPTGFPWNDKKIRQSAMDYIEDVDLIRHTSWDMFKEHYPQRRIILLSTKGAEPYYDFSFHANDILLGGRESAGVPDHIHQSADAVVTIPMKTGMRSMNVINAISMVSGEARRQTEQVGNDE